MPYILILIVGLGAGVWGGKKIYESPITAGTCVDSATKSIGEKFDEVVKVIKQ